MPEYFHRCLTCSSEQSEIYSIRDTPEIKCKVCGEPTQRVIKGVTFKLEGGAWAKDGYK